MTDPATHEVIQARVREARAKLAARQQHVRLPLDRDPPKPSLTTKLDQLRRIREALIALTVIASTFMVVSVTVSACSGGAKVGVRDELPAKADVTPHAKDVKDAATNIRTSTEVIAGAVDTGEQTFPEVPLWLPIRSANDSIVTQVSHLDTTADGLTKTQDVIDARDKRQIADAKTRTIENEKLKAELDKARSEAAAADRGRWGWMGVIGGISIAAGMALMLLTKSWKYSSPLIVFGAALGCYSIVMIAIVPAATKAATIVAYVIAGALSVAIVITITIVTYRFARYQSAAPRAAEALLKGLDPNDPMKMDTAVAAVRGHLTEVDNAVIEIKAEEKKPRKPKPAEPVYAEPPPPGQATGAFA